MWSQASGGPSADALAHAWHARLARRPQDLVLADPGYDTLFDDRVYKRGALTLHALRGAVGDDAFFGLVRDWAVAHAGGTVTTADFREHCAGWAETAGGTALVRTVAGLLGRWLDEPRLPTLARLGSGGAGGTRSGRSEGRQ